MEKNLLNLNLNLLIVLDALLDEQNTTRAALKINSTQPTVSKALNRLRATFEDELLIRGQAGNMYLTPKAKSLKEPVKEAIYKLKFIFCSEEQFNPKKAELTFNIAITDDISLLLLPVLISKLHKDAPKIKFRTFHIHQIKSVTKYDLNMDIYICPENYIPNNYPKQELYLDKAVCIADKNHPAMRSLKLTLDNFLHYPHICATSRISPTENVIEKALKKINKKRKIVGIVPYNIVVLNLLKGTKYLSTASSKLANKYAERNGLISKKLPFNNTEVKVYQYWKREDNNNLPLCWLRNTIKTIAEKL